MAAMLNNGIKRPLSSEAQSSFSTPFKKRVVELLANVNSNVSFSHLSEGYGKEETDVILDVNSNRKSSKTTFYSGATNLSSPSILSHFSSVNHSKDKPVGYYGNHSIEGHQDQNYHSKDISLTCDQQIEVKPHVSYDTHSILRPHHHSNHSKDSSPDHHSNHSVDKLTSQQDKNSTKNVKSDLNAHTNGFSYYKGIKIQNGINRCDENVLGQQNDSEELKVTSYKGSVNDVEVKMNQETKEGYLHSQGNRCQQIKTFDGTLHQTRTSPVFKSEENFAVCHLQGDSSPAVESINTGSVIPTNNHVYSEDPIGKSHQTSDINGNVTPPCDKNNMTDDKQLPKCNGKKEEKRANVMEIYTCSICEKEFRQSGNFYNHMKSHTESLRYCKCGICGSMFDSGEKLLQHMRKEHTGSNPYKCEHCDREFSQYNNLRRHLRVHQEKKFKCRLCDRTFNEEFYLTMHMGTHTGHRTYSCGVCTAEFTSSSDLKNHVKTHPISELHVCDVCGKGFSKACVLRQHKKAHSGERPYKCEQCNKTFIHRHHLTMHMRSHTESKPFTCETCGKEFSQTSHLYKHIRQHLVEAKLLDSNQDGFKGQDEKQVINTLGNNSIPDKLNGEPSNLQQSVKPKPRRKRSKGPRDEEVSPDLSAPSHYALQFSEALANPFQSSSPSSGMFGPLSNEATQNMMKQMNFPPPDHPTQQNPMYMAYAQASMAAYYNNWYMMNYLSHSGKDLGTDYAQDLSLPKRNPFSYESPMPLSHTRDSSPTVNSARNTPISSIPINKEYNHYFHNSTIPKPVEFLNSNVPVSVNGPFDLSLPTTQRRSKYGSIGENDVEDLSSRGSHRSSSPYATSSVSSQPDTLSHSRESSPVDHLKSAPHSIMKPPREEDESELNLHPLEQLGMITTQSNSRHLPLHPFSSSIHNVHKIKNTESKFHKPMRISVHTNSFPDDRSNQQQRKRLRKETYYSSNMDLELRQEIMLNGPDLSKSKAVEDRKLENCRKIKVKDEKVDELKEEANAEEEQHFGENASQPEEVSSLKQQIEEVREMIQHEIQKETIDGMTDSGEEEEEEGRLMIVEQDTEIQTHDSNTSDEKKAELEKEHFVVSQNEKIFSHGKQHDWKRNTFRRDTLQRSQLGSVCCNKTDVSGECIHGTYEEEAEQQGSEDLRWVSGVETSWSHSAVKTNGPFDLLRPRATTPIQRAVNNLVSNDSSGTVLDMSMKCSPAENQQIHRKQKGEERLACPACLTPMDTDSDFFKHLAVSMQCYQLYIARKLREPASSPSEETVLKLAKKYACQEIRDEGIYVSQKSLEEPMDLTERASSKIKSRTVEDLSDHNQSLYHVFCKCCKEPMLNEVALSLHLAKNPRCFHIHYLGRSPVSLRKIDNDSSAESGTLRQIMYPPSGRNSEQTTDKDNKASLKSDMIISQTIKGSQPHVPISSQHPPPSWHYNPTMTHYKQSVPSSQPHFYLLQQDALCPVYSGGTIPYEQDHSLPLALVKKEKSSVDPISSPRNGVHVPREEKKGEEIMKTVATSEASFCCGICWKTFTTSSDLEVHQNEHAPLKNGYYTCEFCDSVFSRPSDFQCHMLTHRDAYGMHQYNDTTTEETKSLSNRKSVEQGQPHVNFSDVKNGINDQYKCHVCGEVFEQAKFYRDHMETHTGEKPYRCTVCSRGFTYKHNLNRHLMSHNAKTFSCSVCGRGFKESFYLQMHMKIHAEEKNRRCEICGQHIPKSDLWQHMIAHLGTSDQNPTYDQIGERVKEILKEQKFSGDNISLSAINEHLKKYLPVSEGLGTLDDLMALTAEFKVFQAVKEKEKDGDNAETKLSYVSNSNVISNNDQSRDGCSDAPKSKRSQNKGEQVCPICNYVFKTKREFGNHLGVHNGERTHICKVCGKGFKKSCILRQHEKIHSGDRPFKCEVCCASFLHYHHLQIHSRVHNGDKPYKCHICGMGFKHSSNLPKHLEMHELESRNQSDNQSKEIQDLESSKAEIESVINMTVKHSVEKDRPTMMAENKSLESGINHLEDANEGNVNSKQVRTEESTETQSTARQNTEGEEECQSKRAKSPAPRNGDSIKDTLALPKEKIPNSPHSQIPCDSSIGKPYSSPETRNQA